MFNGMTNEELTRIYLFNNDRRSRFLNRMNNFKTPIEKANFIVSYFTNNLPKNIVADIDDVEEKDIKDFNYDYSFIRGNETLFAREQEKIKYPLGYGTSMSCVDRDVEIDGKPKIYPTIYALKTGTCTMFAHEIKRLMHEAGIECEIIETPTSVDCYDLFDGKDTDGNDIHVNKIKKIRHAYNIITIDDTKYKIDIAGYLTAKDFNENKSSEYGDESIDVNRFCMTEDLNGNPFEEINTRSLGE